MSTPTRREARGLNCTPAKPGPAAQIEHRQIPPVAQQRVEQFAHLLRSFVAQLLAQVRLEGPRKFRIHLLQRLVRHARRRRLVSQSHQQVPDLRIVGLQLDIFLVSRAGIVAPPQHLGHLAEVVPHVGVVRRQRRRLLLADVCQLLLIPVAQPARNLVQFVERKLAVRVSRIAARHKQSGRHPLLDPALHSFRGRLRKHRREERADLLHAPAAVAQLHDHASRGVQFVQFFGAGIVSRVAVLGLDKLNGGIQGGVLHPAVHTSEAKAVWPAGFSHTAGLS